MKNLGKLELIANEKGFVLVYMALLIVVICGFIGLAVDVGYSYLVKTQLQNAADAGALAGAGTIYPANSSTFPSPDFINAEATATESVKANKAAGANLADTDIVSIQTGYWNLSQNPAGLQPESTIPKGKCSSSGNMCTSNAGCTSTENCLIQDVVAVQVTVQKSVPTFFAKVFGWKEFSPAATAVAAAGYPQAERPFPVAVTKCMVDSYFEQKTLPDPPPEIYIHGPYGPGGNGCNTGQWTSFTYDTNNVPGIEGLMYGTIPTPPIGIGDNIWIDPGTKAVLYQDVQADFVGKDVVLPVVQDVSVSTHSSTPVTGFVTFHIDGAIATGPSKQIYGHFIAYYKDKNASRLGGPKSNTVTPAVLVQ